MPRRDRKNDIMAAAEKLFTSRPVHEVTLDDIVREARVGKGTIYRYFRDKEDLFFETSTRGFDELCELLVRHVPADGPFAGRLVKACRHIGRFFERRRHLYRIMQAQADRVFWQQKDVRERWAQKRRRLHAAVAEILRAGSREGVVRSDVPAEVQASFLLSMLRTRGRELSDAPRDHRSVETLVDLFCRGACPDGKGAVLSILGRADEPPACVATGKEPVAG